MNKDKLIVQLTQELYTLKEKLKNIREYADSAYYHLKFDAPILGLVKADLLDIFNEIDVTEDYNND